MKVRTFKPEDETALRSLHERTFEFPDLADPRYVIKDVVLDNQDKILGAGLLRLTSEVMVILDEKARKRVRAQAVQELLRTGIFQCQQIGMDEMHTFLTGCDSETWARCLEKRFGFIKCSGIPLTLRLTNG